MLEKFRILNVTAALIIIGLVACGYYFIARPYQLNLGATAFEIERDMPGDELDPDPDFLATRAVTIQGTPEEIWPWLIQMSYNRAGFYGYDILENIGSERGMQSAEEIIPEFQEFDVGEEVPISAVHSMAFYAIEPDEFLIWTGEDEVAPGGFTWALYPLEDGQTRLISRIRWSYKFNSPADVLMAVFTDLSDHIAVRKILQGIKARVEGQIEPMWVGNLEFIFFTAVWGFFAAEMLLLSIRPFNWNRVMLALFSGLSWLVFWYAPVPIFIGIFLIAFGVYLGRTTLKERKAS